jgi:hypothetical protein
MKNNSNTATKLNKSLNRATNALNKTMNNPMVSNTIVGVLVIYCVFIASNLPLSVAKVFDNAALRMVLMAVIALVCLVDPIKALLMAIGFVLSVQRLYVLKKQQAPNNQVRDVPLDANNLDDESNELETELNNQVANEPAANEPEANEPAANEPVANEPAANELKEVNEASNLANVVNNNEVDYSNASRNGNTSVIGTSLGDSGTKGLNQGRVPNDNIADPSGQSVNESRKEQFVGGAPSPSNNTNYDKVAQAEIKSSQRTFDETPEGHEIPQKTESDKHHPAYDTMYKQIQQSNVHQQLQAAQTNAAGCNMNKGVKSFTNQHGAQGLSNPSGVSDYSSLEGNF